MIKIRDAVTEQEVQVLEGDYGVRHLKFSSDSMVVASMSLWEVRVWNLITGYKLHTVRIGCRMLSFAFKPNNSQLLVAGENGDGDIEIWDMEAKQNMGTLESGGKFHPVSATFSADSKLLLVTHEEQDFRGAAQVWDVTMLRSVLSRSVIWPLESIINSKFTAVLQGTSAHDEEYQIEVWETATRQVAQTIRIRGKSGPKKRMALSPDSKLLAAVEARTGNGINDVCVWDIATGQKIQTFVDHNSDYIESLTFSADGKLLASGSQRGVKIWDVAAQQASPVPAGHHYPTELLAYSSDSRLLASRSKDKTIVWDAHTGREIHRWDGEHYLSPDFTYRACISGNDELLEETPDNLFGLGDRDGPKRFWDIVAGREVTWSFPHNLKATWLMTLSADSQLLAYYGRTRPGNRVLRVWDTAAQRTIYSWHVNIIYKIAFSFDSQLLAFGNRQDKGYAVTVRDLATGQKVQENCLTRPPSYLSFDATTTLLHIDMGAIPLNLSPRKNILLLGLQGYGLAMSDNDSWVVWNGKKLLWLPPEYR
ncbi:hypothetical protein F5884DRAFT_860598 [Xylogone sp. PMI_703]|nr:hypothetical protein F5884DRAFT_860598 [Xylogone sp. PMI_703]